MIHIFRRLMRRHRRKRGRLGLAVYVCLRRFMVLNAFSRTAEPARLRRWNPPHYGFSDPAASFLHCSTCSRPSRGDRPGDSNHAAQSLDPVSVFAIFVGFVLGIRLPRRQSESQAIRPARHLGCSSRIAFAAITFQPLRSSHLRDYRVYAMTVLYSSGFPPAGSSRCS